MDSIKNLLLSGMQTTLIMSLLYLVKYKYLKTYNFYRWIEDVMVNFSKINNLNAKMSVIVSYQNVEKHIRHFLMK